MGQYIPEGRAADYPEINRTITQREYDKVLRMRYGDYMKLPPENERVFLHSLECYMREPE